MLKSEARGSLDVPEHGLIRGWAINPANPGARATVAFTIDGKPLELVTANEFRSDLLAAGVGDGHHAFSVQLPKHLLDGKPHAVEAKVHGTDVTLQHSPRTVVFSNSLKPPIDHVTLPDSLLNGLSVIIATKNNGERLERTLRACAQCARNLPIEFLVADYGSTDGTPQRLKTLATEIPNLRALTLTAASPGAARNQAIAAASRELILLLGDSITPTVPTFFEHHMNAHHMLPAKNIAVLGRITLSDQPDDRVSFLMSHLHGAGAQQFWLS